MKPDTSCRSLDYVDRAALRLRIQSMERASNVRTPMHQLALQLQPWPGASSSFIDHPSLTAGLNPSRSDFDSLHPLHASHSNAPYDLSLAGTCDTSCAGATFARNGVCLKCSDPNAASCNAKVSTLWYVNYGCCLENILPSLPRLGTMLIFSLNCRTN